MTSGYLSVSNLFSIWCHVQKSLVLLTIGVLLIDKNSSEHKIIIVLWRVNLGSSVMSPSAANTLQPPSVLDLCYSVMFYCCFYSHKIWKFFHLLSLANVSTYLASSSITYKKKMLYACPISLQNISLTPFFQKHCSLMHLILDHLCCPVIFLYLVWPCCLV